MAMKKQIVLSCIAFGCCIVLGCKDTNNPLLDNSPSNVVFPTSGVSYGRHVQPLFNQACAQVGCHSDDAGNASRLRLTSYANTTDPSLLIVVPRHPENSRLVWSIEGSNGSTRMPPSGYPLNQNQIDGIRTWITEGALNN